MLEIGSGSGYQTAVLARLARSVYSLERIDELARSASALLASLGFHNVSIKAFDGTYGYPAAAPYDRILVTAGTETVPEPLLAQLAVGGRLVVPIGPPGGQRLRVIRRRKTDYAQEDGRRRDLRAPARPLRGNAGMNAGGLTARRAIVRGRVQGVGFRFFAERAARELGVRGWVRNLPDGTVETFAEGEDDAVAAIPRAAAKGPARIPRRRGRRHRRPAGGHRPIHEFRDHAMTDFRRYIHDVPDFPSPGFSFAT